jgi:aryl-phospho-beta-D-glucosidase BglC (GH1 family)
LGIVFVFCLFIICNGRTISNSNNELIRAVNLGGWLVTEGWMKPSLFESILNKDFLDGVKLQFNSVTTKKFLAAELGGGTIIVANRTSPSDWETFRLWRINETSFHVRVFNKQFLGIDSNGINLVATSTDSENSGIFDIIRNSDTPNRVRIKAPNGLFLQAKTEDLVTVDSNGDGQWGDDDPSVFIMTFAGARLEGEYQVTNGYGPLKAPQIMKDHWDTFIEEKDFSFIADSKLNAVRIPVGWWAAKDPTPPRPYVGGSLEVLDRAFVWARKYNLKVILDLHAAPGSQNGFEHSSSRDGFIEWGQTENIEESVRIIEFFTARYATNPCLYAVDLLNEPNASGVSLSMLTTFYNDAYKAVRRHAPDVFVILSNRLSGDPKELFPLASGMTAVVIDVHYYNLFSGIFNGMSVDQNIDFIQTNRSNELQEITTSDGPLTFVGEWVAEWQVSEASKEDYQRFSNAQMQVWGRATFGWAYWSLKHASNHWSMEWMITNGYINL